MVEKGVVQDGQDHGNNGRKWQQRGVFAAEKRSGALPDGITDGGHGLVTRVGLQDPHSRDGSEGQGQHTADQGYDNGNHGYLSGLRKGPVQGPVSERGQRIIKNFWVSS